MVDAVNQLQNDLFLLTPLREGRPSVTRQAIRVKENFYSRPCGRGDDFVVTTKQKGAISTHAPAGGATFNNGRQFDSDGKFLLTPLREGRLGGGGNYQLQAKFLLTPLREGRHGVIDEQERPEYISTHAPAGGATFHVDSSLLFFAISTHAPAGGATICGSCQPLQFIISTHAPAGGATCRVSTDTSISSISTHAPAGGATWKSTPGRCSAVDFYSRPCGRGDTR